MTSLPIPCRITMQSRRSRCDLLCTRSSGDRAFGSGPKGRRFDSCRVRNEESPRNQGFSGFFYLLEQVIFGVKTRFGVLLVSYCIFFCFCRTGWNRFWSTSAAASSADLIAWIYVFVVVAVEECPSLLDTVATLTPFAISRVAFV